MLVWLEVFVLAIAAFALAIKLQHRKIVVGDSWKLGIFLSAFDWLFETCGAVLRLWTSSQSLFMLGFVPVEVSLIAFLAGTAYRLLVPKKLGRDEALAILLSISIIGVITERVLIQLGVIMYLNWNSFLAFIAYFAAFWLVKEVNARF